MNFGEGRKVKFLSFVMFIKSENEEEKNMLKVNDKIKVHLYDTSDREMQTRHINTVFTVYEKSGKLGIDWNTERSPYTCKGDIFTPFYTFASTVIFENVETGEKYHFSNIKNDVEMICAKSIPCCGCSKMETCTLKKDI